MVRLRSAPFGGPGAGRPPARTQSRALPPRTWGSAASHVTSQASFRPHLSTGSPAPPSGPAELGLGLGSARPVIHTRAPRVAKRRGKRPPRNKEELEQVAMTQAPGRRPPRPRGRATPLPAPRSPLPAPAARAWVRLGAPPARSAHSCAGRRAAGAEQLAAGGRREPAGEEPGRRSHSLAFVQLGPRPSGRLAPRPPAPSPQKVRLPRGLRAQPSG